MVLGFFPDYPYQQGSCHLNRGELLLLFSDGVTEARAPDGDEEFGEARLAEFVRHQRNSSPEDLIAAINDELRLFTGGAAAADDITLVPARQCLYADR